MPRHLAQKGLGLQFHYGTDATQHQHAAWLPNAGFLFKLLFVSLQTGTCSEKSQNN